MTLLLVLRAHWLDSGNKLGINAWLILDELPTFSTARFLRCLVSIPLHNGEVCSADASVGNPVTHCSHLEIWTWDSVGGNRGDFIVNYTLMAAADASCRVEPGRWLCLIFADGASFDCVR